VKVGGSVLTDKSSRETLDEASFERVVDAVARALEDDAADDAADGAVDDLVLVHGAGSFGHPHAAAHALGEGGREGAYATHRAVSALNRRFVDALDAAGVDALPVHPLSCAVRDDSLTMMTDQVGVMRDEGFVPVLHGDVVAHLGRGVSVVSGDALVVALADALGDGRVGMCTAAGGVLDADGERLDAVGAVDEVPVLEGDDADDVTGGIRGKVERLLSLDGGGRVFGVDDLSRYLRGDDVGTRVVDGEGS
jgi:isopentenyl phosphate kinase